MNAGLETLVNEKPFSCVFHADNRNFFPLAEINVYVAPRKHVMLSDKKLDAVKKFCLHYPGKLFDFQFLYVIEEAPFKQNMNAQNYFQSLLFLDPMGMKICTFLLEHSKFYWCSFHTTFSVLPCSR